MPSRYDARSADRPRSHPAADLQRDHGGDDAVRLPVPPWERFPGRALLLQPPQPARPDLAGSYLDQDHLQLDQP